MDEFSSLLDLQREDYVHEQAQRSLMRSPIRKDWVKWDEARKSGHLSRATAHAALTAAGFEKRGTNAAGYHVYEHQKSTHAKTRAKIHEHDSKTHVFFEHVHRGVATLHSAHATGNSTPLDVFNAAHQALAESPTHRTAR